MSSRVCAAFASPIFDSVREYLQALPEGRLPHPGELNRICHPGNLNAAGIPIRFVRPELSRDRSFAGQFEVRVFLRGEIAMREASWHDLFNALAWIAFPRSKAAINRRHFEELEAQRLNRGRAANDKFTPDAKRSAARDALTIFDEGGVIVASTNPGMLELIRKRHWRSLFLERRPELRRCMRFFVFGHALHEKGMNPYKGMTARTLLLQVPESFLDCAASLQREEVDRLLAERIRTSDSFVSPRSLFPLPVMGIPGWDENDDPAFYDDTGVFR